VVRPSPILLIRVLDSFPQGTHIFNLAITPEDAEAIMKRVWFGFGLLTILAGSAFSQTVKRAPAFYIVLNSLTMNCTIVDKTPRTDTPNITVASDAIYKTRVEAETAIKTLTPCKQ
jgi:hypothetical protein